MGQDIAGWRIAAVADNVIFLVGFGAWGEQEVRAFCAEYRELVAGLAGGPWAVMGDATDWVLDDPLVLDVLRDHNRWIVEAGCRAGSFYTGPGALNRLLLYRLSEPDSDHYRFRVHPHQSRAVEALAESGFPVTDAQLNRFFRGEGKRI